MNEKIEEWTRKCARLFVATKLRLTAAACEDAAVVLLQGTPVPCPIQGYPLAHVGAR